MNPMLLSRLASRPGCQLLSHSLCLPPQTLFRRPRQQAFHAEGAPLPARDPFVNSLLTVADHTFDTIHSLGIPWAYAIPAAALAVRVVILSPLTLHGLKVRARRANLQPLASAAAHVGLRQLQSLQVSVKHDHLTGLHRDIRSWRKYQVLWQRKRWKASAFDAFLPTFIQLPVFLIMAESLRTKLGTEEGLLALLVKGFRNTKEWLMNLSKDRVQVKMEEGVDASAITGAARPPTNADMKPEGVVPSHSQESSVNVEVDPYSNPSIHKSAQDTIPIQSGEPTINANLNPQFDSSLANEGILWFPDLTVADPYHCLPFVISGLTIYNIWRASRQSKNWVRRPLMGVALIMGPLLWDAPAGLLLYWISSNLWATAMMNILELRWPAPKPLTACKRPLILPPRS